MNLFAGYKFNQLYNSPCCNTSVLHGDRFCWKCGGKFTDNEIHKMVKVENQSVAIALIVRYDLLLMSRLKIYHVSYFLITFAVLSALAGIYLMFEKSAFEDIAINFFRAILLFFVGGNLLLYKKWAWWLALIFIGFMVLQFSVGTYLTIIKPIFIPNHSGVGILRWIILILNPIVIIFFYYLLLSSTREKFNKIT